MKRNLLAIACSLAAASAMADSRAGSFASDEIAALANEVSLELWQIAGAESCAGNLIEEHWAAIYSPKDPVGAAGNWNEQLGRAKVLVARPLEVTERHWIELFIKAGEAVARRDAHQFSLAVRELKPARLSLTGPEHDKAGDSPKLFSVNGAGPGYPKLNLPRN